MGDLEASQKIKAAGGSHYETMPISIDHLNLTRPSNENNTLDSRRKPPRLALYCGVTLILCVSITFILLAATHARVAKLKRASSDEKTDIDQSLSAYQALKYGLNKKQTISDVGCEGTVLIMRHCEGATHTKGHCSYLGFERANYIASLFGNTTEERWPVPTFLYATRKERVGVEHYVFREVDTLTPLSKKIGIPIGHETYGETGVNLADKIHSDLLAGELCGRLAVVAWKHDYIPLLAENLGCGPLDGCPMYYDPADFDTVWQLKFVYDTPGNIHDSSKPEWLIYASLVKEEFDPLRWSKISGDYPQGGKETGGTWSEIGNSARD